MARSCPFQWPERCSEEEQEAARARQEQSCMADEDARGRPLRLFDVEARPDGRVALPREYSWRLVLPWLARPSSGLSAACQALHKLHLRHWARVCALRAFAGPNELFSVPALARQVAAARWRAQHGGGRKWVRVANDLLAELQSVRAVCWVCQAPVAWGGHEPGRPIPRVWRPKRKSACHCSRRGGRGGVLPVGGIVGP